MTKMIHNILGDLLPLATPLNKIRIRENNPWTSDVDAMMAVLKGMGQHRPVVVQGTRDKGGTATAGNHMYLAAQRLGWTHVAAIFEDEDDTRAMLRAVTDNQMQLQGKPREDLIAEFLPTVIEEYGEILAPLGWDDFAVAAMEMDNEKPTSTERGYVPAEIRTNEEFVSRETSPREGTDEELITWGGGGTDERRAAVVQYTLVFDDSDMQKRWQHFVRYLRSSATADQTTAALLIEFCENNAKF